MLYMGLSVNERKSYIGKGRTCKDSHGQIRDQLAKDDT